MPEWLLKKDDYILQDDRDSFIGKTILSILNMMGRFTWQNGDMKSRSNALVKAISIFLMIIFVSMTRSLAYILIIGTVLLAGVNFLSVEKIKGVIRAGITAALFTLMILLPSIFLGYGNNALMVVLKVLISAAAVSAVASTVMWSDLTGSLKLLHVPDMFILILDITIKYIMILGNFSLDMVYALKLRSVGKNQHKNSSLSGIMGTLFLKSKEMAEEMYETMECRGFSGEYRPGKELKINLYDLGYILFDALLILSYFYFDRL